LGVELSSLRYFMHRKGATENIVLRIVLRAIAISLKSNFTSAVHLDIAAKHIGAVALIHRSGFRSERACALPRLCGR